MEKMKKFLVFLVLLVFLVSLVSVSIAKNENSNKGNSENNDDGELKIKSENENGKIKQKIKVKNEGLEMEIETEFEAESMNEELKVKIKGKEKSFGVAPDLAASIAYDALMSDNLTITLNGTNESVFYEVMSSKNGKFLWLFNSEVKIKARIDPETGNITIKKPWWAVFVSGEDRDESNATKVVICHIPRGNPSNKHSISIGRPALKAHLKHGDYIGSCGRIANDTNVTNPGPGNQTNVSLGITLLKPENNSIYNTTVIPLEFVPLSLTSANCFYILNSGNETSISGCLNATINAVEGNHSIYLRIREGNNSAVSNIHDFRVILPIENNETNSTA